LCGANFVSPGVEAQKLFEAERKKAQSAKSKLGGLNMLEAECKKAQAAKNKLVDLHAQFESERSRRKKLKEEPEAQNEQTLVFWQKMLETEREKAQADKDKLVANGGGLFSAPNIDQVRLFTPGLSCDLPGQGIRFLLFVLFCLSFCWLVRKES
jgi:hypothetical protein